MNDKAYHVGLFTSVYFNNIGNGFIDLGAEAALLRALPECCTLTKVSQCANFAASMGKAFALKETPVINWAWVHLMQRFASKLHDRTYSAVRTLDVLSVPDIVDFDCLIIPGCVLTVPFFTIYGGVLKKKALAGTKIIFLGVSGNFYTEYEVQVVSEFLKELKPYAIITRDALAYEYYSQFAERSMNGIDNVFFVNLLQIPELHTNPEEYVVVNIEEPKHQKLKDELVTRLTREGKNIIYSYHKPYPYSKVSKLVKQGVIVSDYPMDYLVLYKNASEVYSDRVHACIPTLSFGNKATLLSDSPRKALFENVGIQQITDEPMTVCNLSNQQERQISFLIEIFEDLC